MKKGFTLAEVLVTLAIIGVVAALTMPSLIANYKKQETIARLKKFYSSWSQAVLMAQADKGEVENWTFPLEKTVEGSAESVEKFFMEYLAPNVKYTRIDKVQNSINTYFPDGSQVNISMGACVDIRFDTNGSRQPNVHGRDAYLFTLCPKSAYNNYCGNKIYFCPFLFGQIYNRADALDKCKNSWYCSGLLMLDNWEFKEDYPFKL
ncbi:MAG: type II secretion system GspH family protein [Heliobacteriaceae bacterium]|nr:type II secretion system GspH family protein [Heliobacteriaceae bacterium]